VNLKTTVAYENGTNGVTVSCLNETSHIGDEPLGSKQFATNGTYKVMLTAATVSSEKYLPLAIKFSNFGWIFKIQSDHKSSP
jgi:hypothetical protein